MAIYLRDEEVRNISLDQEVLFNISNLFHERKVLLLKSNPELAEDNIFFSCIIRFDNKGYRVFSFDELKNYFDQADEVERIVITLETASAISSNRNVGDYLELRLDSKDINGCWLVASSDHKDWCDASFSAVQEILVKQKTANGLLRSVWINLGVQLFGIFLLFVTSLFAASKLAKYLAVENSFAISFLFVLIVLSNIWGHFNQIILNVISSLFPNVKFLRLKKENFFWLWQAVVGSTVFAVVFYFLSLIANFLIEIMQVLLKK